MWIIWISGLFQAKYLSQDGFFLLGWHHTIAVYRCSKNTKYFKTMLQHLAEGHGSGNINHQNRAKAQEADKRSLEQMEGVRKLLH